MLLIVVVFYFFKQKAAYELRISDWSSDVCSSDLQVGSGAAIQGRMLKMALDHHVDIRTEMGVTDLVEEQGRIVGVITEKDGKPWRIEARDGVLINAGGFARNAELRRKYGPQPSSTDCANANPGRTGTIAEIARAPRAAAALT